MSLCGFPFQNISQRLHSQTERLEKGLVHKHLSNGLNYAFSLKINETVLLKFHVKATTLRHLMRAHAQYECEKHPMSIYQCKGDEADFRDTGQDSNH